MVACSGTTLMFVMAGLVPAIHVFAARQGVDARHKAGHDEVRGGVGGAA